MTDSLLYFGSVARPAPRPERLPTKPRRRLSMEKHYGPILDRIAARRGPTVLFFHRGRIVDQEDSPGLQRRLYLDCHRSVLGKVRSRAEALELIQGVERRRGFPWWWRRTPLDGGGDWR